MQLFVHRIARKPVPCPVRAQLVAAKVRRRKLRVEPEPADAAVRLDDGGEEPTLAEHRREDDAADTGANNEDATGFGMGRRCHASYDAYSAFPLALAAQSDPTQWSARLVCVAAALIAAVSEHWQK